MVSFNVPIMSIIAYYVVAVHPHGTPFTSLSTSSTALRIASGGDIKVHDNRNPKSSSYHQQLRARLGEKKFAAFERAESCHRNHLENMPLYIACVFAGLLAESKVGAGEVGLNTFIAGFLAVRVAYTVNYLNTESQKYTYLRSLLYFVNVGQAFTLLYRAAYAIGN